MTLRLTIVGVAFATDARTLAYYDRRAAEYDDWWLGEGMFAGRERPGWHEEVAEVVGLMGSLEPARTLDVACGTAFLSRHVRGFVVGLDQSASMVAIAQARLRDGLALTGDALRLPFADGAFDRVLAGHFYGHLVAEERNRFLDEARRVAGELLIVDSALHEGVEPEGWQERKLRDGTRHRVYKRYLRPDELAGEIDGEALYGGRWFVAARSGG